jgi:hypothetical protein
MNDLVWAGVHALLFFILVAIILARPGYWAGSLAWYPAAWQVFLAACRGGVAPKAARVRWQFTCVTCGAMAALFTSLSYGALWLSLPHAHALAEFGQGWLLFVLVAFALGSLSAGRDDHAVG